MAPNPVNEERLTWLKRIASWDPLQQVLNLGGLYLIFPLCARVSVPVVCAVAASCWLLLGGRTPTRASKLAAGILAVGGFLWAVFGPFVAFSGVKYCNRAQSNVPWKAEVISINSGSHAVGELLYITDPVRTSAQVRLALKRMGVATEVIEDTSQGERHMLTIPLTNAIRRTIGGTGKELFAEELIVPYAGTGMSVSLIGSCTGKDCSVGTPVQVVVAAFALVDWVRAVADPSDRPWTTVKYPTGREREAALYAAQIDFALQSFSRGDFEGAFGGMESASIFAPTDLERSRLFALLGQMSVVMLSGNIGEAQSLASFDRAMRIWVNAHHARPVSRTELSDPVDRWLFDIFWTLFFNHQAQYPAWRVVLGYNTKPAAKFATLKLPREALFWRRFEILPSTQAESLVSAERQRLHEIVVRADYGGIPEALNRYISARPDVARWVFTTLVGNPEIVQLMMTSREPWQEALEYAAHGCLEPWATQYLNLISTIQLIQNSNMQMVRGEGGPATEKIAALFSRSGFPLSSRAFLGMATGPDPFAPLHQAAGELTPDAPWWDRRYRDWFGAVALTSLLGLAENCDEPGPKCGQFLENLATRCERDRVGTGNLFAPGIALALAFSEGVAQPISSRWAKAFSDATGMQKVVLSNEQLLPPALANPRVP